MDEVHSDRTTGLDRMEQHAGYSPSSWPVECGGNRRQKAALGRLDAASGTARVTTRQDNKWHVMIINRQADPVLRANAQEPKATNVTEPTAIDADDPVLRANAQEAEPTKQSWYLGGTMPAFSGPPPFGWVERIDPETLEAVAESPELPCGEHVWCGAILAHANGSILSVNGSYLHRLDPDDLSIIVERELPADRSHNGLLALADGTLITKDLRLEGQGGTTITRVDPDSLELVGEPLVLPEGSMGRIAGDVVAGVDERVYVPGTEHLWRLRIDGDAMIVEDWQPRYRTLHGDYGLAWDSCISDGACWSMDCGDITSVRMIHTTEPNGRWDAPPGRALSWRQPAPWSGPQRLIRTCLENPEDVRTVAPFGTPGGGIIAPPVHVPEHNMTIAWDSVNGGLAGVTMEGDDLEVAWHLDVRPSMQPVVYPESGELVINDFTDAGSDDLIVVDIASGELIDRVSTGSRVANGMFLSPGPGRSVFYCSTLTVARVTWG